MTRTHKLRLLRNLALAALLVFFLWCEGGFPLPTAEMELHRRERQLLADRSTVVWAYDSRYAGTQDMLVGTTMDAVHVYEESYRILTVWPRRRTEPTLVLLPEETPYVPEGKWHLYLAPALLAVDPPAGAETARLTLTPPEGWDPPLNTDPYVISSVREDGLFFFQLTHKYRNYSGDVPLSESQLQKRDAAEASFFSILAHHGSRQQSDLLCYTLEFFDSGGELIEAVTN